MSTLLSVARAAAVVNAVLLAALAVVWVRNYVELRSKHTLGLLLFGLFLLAENLLALYYYLSGIAVPDPAMRAMMYLQVLETGGIAFLAWVTFD